MNHGALLFAASSAVLNAIATVSLRQAGIGARLVRTFDTPLGTISDLHAVALVSYAGAFLGYALALRQMNAAMAYPLIVGLAFMLILAVEVLWFRQSLSTLALVGGALVLLGIAFISRAAIS